MKVRTRVFEVDCGCAARPFGQRRCARCSGLIRVPSNRWCSVLTGTLLPLHYHRVQERRQPLRPVWSDPPPLAQVKADDRGTLANHDCVGIGKGAPVDVDSEVAGGETRQRTMYAARELVARGARTDRLPNRESEQVAHAKRRGKRERSGAAEGDCVKIERHLHSDHENAISAVSRSCLLPG